MKKALISPNEKVFNSDGVEIGERVAEVAVSDFPVAPPLFWIDCNDDVEADVYYYDPATQEIKLTPVTPPVVSQTQQPTVQGAQNF